MPFAQEVNVRSLLSICSCGALKPGRTGPGQAVWWNSSPAWVSRPMYSLFTAAAAALFDLNIPRKNSAELCSEAAGGLTPK